MAITPDGRRVAHSGWTGTTITDVTSGRPLATVEGAGEVRQLAFSPDGDVLAIADGSLGVVDLTDAEPARHEVLVGGVTADTSTRYPTALLNALRQSDVKALVRQNKAVVERLWEATLPGLRALRLSDGQIATVHAQMRAFWRRTLARSLAARAGTASPKPLRAAERVRCVGFSRDGRWMWCGTDGGLRVFRRATLPKPGQEVAAEPFWTAVLPGGGGVVAVAEEPGAAAVLFGGDGSHLTRLALTSGAVTPWVDLPGVSGVTDLVLSIDGCSLGVAGKYVAAEGRRDRSTWQVWDRQRL